ncbi:MAG TPA: hypothetical protein VHI11_01570 [Jiangellaceae bacterium]|jgi:hypothetical protein|nr:hypothetical protein [Jiangellaceae bacterium]
MFRLRTAGRLARQLTTRLVTATVAAVSATAFGLLAAPPVQADVDAATAAEIDQFSSQSR